VKAVTHLVAMANDIAAFFEPEAGAQAPQAICEHLLKFWEPRMRAQIVGHLDGGGEGLTPVARDAVQLLRGAGPAAAKPAAADRRP
jgi:formate dehydrogenase subunit delta